MTEEEFMKALMKDNGIRPETFVRNAVGYDDTEGVEIFKRYKDG